MLHKRKVDILGAMAHWQGSQPVFHIVQSSVAAKNKFYQNKFVRFVSYKVYHFPKLLGLRISFPDKFFTTNRCQKLQWLN